MNLESRRDPERLLAQVEREERREKRGQGFLGIRLGCGEIRVFPD